MATNGNGTNGTLASNREAMDRFLDKLRHSGNVRLSCKAAGVPRRTAYNWRDKWKTFADEWAEALEEALDILEAEAWRRAVEESSDRLLMFLLKAHRRGLYGDKQELDIRVNDVDAAIERELAKLASRRQDADATTAEGCECGGCTVAGAAKQ